MRAIMWNTHGGSDAEGAWEWRTAYDCAEAVRIVAILPDGAFGPRQSKWFTQLLDQAQVRLHIALPRAAFAKSGTTIPTRLLVLDKDCGPSAVPTCHHVDTMTEVAQRIVNLAPAPLAAPAAGQMTRQQSAAPASTTRTPSPASAQAPVKSQTSPHLQSSSSAIETISARSRNEETYGAATTVKRQARGSEQAVVQANAPALLGRVLSEDQAYMLARQLNPKHPATLEEQVDHVLRGGGSAQLGDGLALRRSRVAGVYRLELTGASADQAERLKYLGAFTEIIAYQLRVFLPMGESGDTGDDVARILRGGLGF
jgi:hypothetical protein